MFVSLFSFEFVAPPPSIYFILCIVWSSCCVYYYIDILVLTPHFVSRRLLSCLLSLYCDCIWLPGFWPVCFTKFSALSIIPLYTASGFLIHFHSPAPYVTEGSRHTGPSTMLFDHEHDEEYLLFVWSRNTEFAHRHHVSVSVSPCTQSVTLGHISLHPACPESSVSSVSRSSFSGTRLAFCPRNYGPRSRRQGRNSKPHRRTPLSVDGVPILQPSVSDPSPVPRDLSPVPRDPPLVLPRSSLFPVPCPCPVSLVFVFFIDLCLLVFLVLSLWLPLPVFISSCLLFGLPVVFTIILTFWFWPPISCLADYSLAFCLCTMSYIWLPGFWPVCLTTISALSIKPLYTASGFLIHFHSPTPDVIPCCLCCIYKSIWWRGFMW